MIQTTTRRLPLLFLLAVFFSVSLVKADDSHIRRRATEGDVVNDIVGGSVQSTPISYFAKFEGGNGLCGGSLIANDIVLTAAHCVDSKAGGFPPQVRIASTTESDGTVVDVDVAKSIFHPGWTGNVDDGNDGKYIKYLSTYHEHRYQKFQTS